MPKEQAACQCKLCFLEQSMELFVSFPSKINTKSKTHPWAILGQGLWLSVDARFVLNHFFHLFLALLEGSHSQNCVLTLGAVVQLHPFPQCCFCAGRPFWWFFGQYTQNVSIRLTRLAAQNQPSVLMPPLWCPTPDYIKNSIQLLSS